jgi:hypothetical protein
MAGPPSPPRHARQPMIASFRPMLQPHLTIRRKLAIKGVLA